MTRIAEGATEQIAVFEARRTTGLADLFVRLQRVSDGRFFDWSDATFKASGWVTLDRPLVEVDAVRLPGLYEVSGGFDTSAITNSVPNDTYWVWPVQSPGTSAVLPSPGEISVGQWVTRSECHFSVAYHEVATTERVRVSAWLTRNDEPVLAPTAITIRWYDEGGTLLFSKTEADPEITGPDARGVFLLVTAAGDFVLATKRAYYCQLLITDGLGTVTTTHGVPTAG